MADPVAVTISALALAVSATTAWLTLFRRGTVKMTQPTVVFLGPDGGPPSSDGAPPPKIYLRTLLFSTSKRGRVIESMHVRVTRNETHQNFNIWVHGDAVLVRGSGLFVGETGVAANHHFLTPRDARGFRFTEGQYLIEVFARLLGDKQRTLLFAQTLEITRDLAVRMEELGAGTHFDWGPDSLRYIPHVEKHSPSPDSREFLEALTQRVSARSDKQPSV